MTNDEIQAAGARPGDLAARLQNETEKNEIPDARMDGLPKRDQQSELPRLSPALCEPRVDPEAVARSQACTHAVIRFSMNFWGCYVCGWLADYWGCLQAIPPNPEWKATGQESVVARARTATPNV